MQATAVLQLQLQDGLCATHVEDGEGGVHAAVALADHHAANGCGHLVAVIQRVLHRERRGERKRKGGRSRRARLKRRMAVLCSAARRTSI